MALWLPAAAYCCLLLPAAAVAAAVASFQMVGGKCLIPWRAPPCVGRGRRIILLLLLLFFFVFFFCCWQKSILRNPWKRKPACWTDSPRMGKRFPLRLPGSEENVLFPGALPLASAGVGGYIYIYTRYFWPYYYTASVAPHRCMVAPRRCMRFYQSIRGPCFFWSPTLFFWPPPCFFDPSWMKS